MFCEKCGSKVDEQGKFCEQCGSPIVNKVEEKVKVTNNKPNKPANRKKLSTKMEITIAAVVVLLLVAGNIFIFKGILGKKDSEPRNTSTTKVDTEVKSEDTEVKSEEDTSKNTSEGSEDKAVNSEEPKQYKHNYELIQKNLNWEEAKAYCESLGGHLATITSKEEEDKILNLLESSDIKVVWLGADDLNSTGSFNWVNGEAFNYSNWAVNEPNNDNGVEHYLVMYKVEGNWMWNDGPLDTNKYYKAENIGFVCEWEVEE